MFIRGLPWRATEDEVREYFTTCGEIVSIDLPLQDDGRSSGTCKFYSVYNFNYLLDGVSSGNNSHNKFLITL